MLTRWGKGLTPETTWTEYPRPQMVRSNWQNLNGTWQYAITERASAGIPAQWQGEILVPFCLESQLSGVALSLGPGQRLWYRREFAANDSDKRTLLHCGAVDFASALWINGAYVDAHKGGFDAFSVDITEFLQQGVNELIVAVSDPTSRGDQPRGKQHHNPNGIWYTPVSGIWQTVWLEQVPQTNHIEEVRITPAPDCRSIDLVTLLARPSRDPELAVRIEVRLHDKQVIELIGRPDRVINIPIPDAWLWSPDQPTLYDATISLVKVRNPLPQVNDESRSASLQRDTPLRGATELALYAQTSPISELDEVRSYFGMRSIRVGPHPETNEPTLLLNEVPIFQLGVLDQGWWPDGLQTPPADAAIVHELQFLKSAGFNTLRKHIKVEPGRYYYHCDRLGILVWQDMPSGFLPAQFVAPNDEQEGLRHARATDQFETELRRMLSALHNHPSIVMWVLHNEGWGQFDTQRLTDVIKARDPSRVVNSVSGWLDTGSGDIIDRHDYESTPQAPAGDGRRARVVGEYGGHGWPVEDHLWNPAMRNWGYHTFTTQAALQDAYAQTTAAIITLQRQHNVCAAIYTQTADVEGEVNGLLTYDREVQKLDPDWLRQIHAPLWSSSKP